MPILIDPSEPLSESLRKLSDQQLTLYAKTCRCIVRVRPSAGRAATHSGTHVTG